MKINLFILNFLRTPLKTLNPLVISDSKRFITVLLITFSALFILEGCLKKDLTDNSDGTTTVVSETVACGEWNIAVHSWVGSVASAAVFAEVARTEYGCTINLISYENEYETTYSALEKGELDLVLEDWGNGRWKPWTEKKAFKLLGSNGQEGRIGMYLPEWMVLRYPDITTSSNLNKYSSLFKIKESDTLGAWYEGPEEWTSIGSKLIESNQLKFKLINFQTEKDLINAFLNADQNQTAFIGYWWTPHFLNAQLPLVRVNFPENDWSTTEEANGDTDYPAIVLMKLASNRLMESESPLLNLATNFQWTNEDQNHVAAQIEEGI